MCLCGGDGVVRSGGYVWAYNVQPYYESIHRSPAEIGRYMSWIPLVGGSIGVVVGGVISDILLKKCGPLGRMGVLIVSQVGGGAAVSAFSVNVKRLLLIYYSTLQS